MLVNSEALKLYSSVVNHHEHRLGWVTISMNIGKTAATDGRTPVCTYVWGIHESTCRRVTSRPVHHSFTCPVCVCVCVCVCVLSSAVGVGVPPPGGGGNPDVPASSAGGSSERQPYLLAADAADSTHTAVTVGRGRQRVADSRPR